MAIRTVIKIVYTTAISALTLLLLLSEKSKKLNPLKWTKLMNNYKNTAEEIVLNEYVFI